MTYQEALQYLNSFINYEKQSSYDYNKSFKLERMKKIAALLDDPQDSIKSIHVAGTKGKGSTSAIIHSILKNANLKVGLYTSPHLVSFRERIRINDSFITEEEVCGLLERLKKAVDKTKDDSYSFFEVYTALAYMYFKDRRVDFAVYETGLGGRLDATNIVQPLVCAITPISYEHTDKLGDTLEEIASEKGGIIKENSICVSAPQIREAHDAIEDICKRKNTKLIVVGKNILFKEICADDEKEVFSVFGLFGEYPLLEMRLLGSHQVVNAATAIGVIEALRFRGITIPYEAIRKGVENARWAGRFDIVSRKPFIVLDGAQNRASANALADTVRKLLKYKKLILVLGVSKDKDVNGILEELLPITDRVVLTKSKVVERALEPHKIKELLNSKDKDTTITEDVNDALNKATSMAAPEDLILITGSLFVVGEAHSIMMNESEIITN